MGSSPLHPGAPSAPTPDAYALVLSDLSKMTPFTREAIMTAMIEAGAVKR